MCEPGINMPMPPHSPSSSPSPSRSTSTPTRRSQFVPISPERSTRYSPELVKRMQGDTCYRCGQIGHWSYDCPVSPPNTKRLSRSLNQDSPVNPTRIFCRCGHGLCVVKTSSSVKNPGRKYYACPIERGKPCSGFVQFCDKPIDESYMQPPPYKYPECECGAGVCGKEKDPDSNKYCFVCPVKKGHGSCGYKVLEEELLGSKSIVPIQQSSQNHYDYGEEGDLLVEHSKRMRMMDNPQTPVLTAISELPQGDDAATKAAPSRHVGFPEFEVADDLREVVNSVPWDAFEKEALLLSRQSTPSRIRCRQNLFGNNSFAGCVADASFGGCPMGWLGRLIFLHPTHGLKFPTPQPFFCCIFPSFDPIAVPKQAITCDDPCERNQHATTNHGKHAQLSLSGSSTEVSCDVGHTVSRDVVSVSPTKSQGSGRKSMSKAERQRQMVVSNLQQLLVELESMNPHDHESMRVAVEDTFALLGGLLDGLDYVHFSEQVRDFINNASAVAEIDKSMENSPTLEECNQRIEEERARFAQIHEECVKTEALLEASNRHRQWLREEVSNLEVMLHGKKNQLNSCEKESLKIETHLCDLKRRMTEADTTLKGRAEEAELARRLNEERRTKQVAAKVALARAKLELEN